MRAIRHLVFVVAAAGVTACASAGTSSGSTSAGGANARSSDASAIANAIEATNAPYVGSKKSKKYYPAACHTVKLIKVADQVGFTSQKDAEAAGFAKDVYSTDCQY